MASRVSPHVYRNRHGTFYFRLVLPADVRYFSKCREKRFSLQTEIRSVAIVKALPVIAAKASFIAKLREMAASTDLTNDNCEERISNLYKRWLSEVRKNYRPNR